MLINYNKWSKWRSKRSKRKWNWWKRSRKRSITGNDDNFKVEKRVIDVIDVIEVDNVIR